MNKPECPNCVSAEDCTIPNMRECDCDQFDPTDEALDQEARIKESALDANRRSQLRKDA